MSRILSAIVLTLLVAAPAMAQTPEVGYASWYNRGFQGLSTASGEAYDHEALTAAHPTLPFGTRIRVVRTDDERSVTVTVNDRMVSGPGHVLDLSGAAARALGLMDTGVARVRIEQTGIAAETSAPSTGVRTVSVETTVAPGSGSYTLQLGVFSSLEAAQDLAGSLDGSWVKSVVTGSGTMYRVYFQTFETEAPARSAQAQLWDDGIESFLRSL